MSSQYGHLSQFKLSSSGNIRSHANKLAFIYYTALTVFLGDGEQGSLFSAKIEAYYFVQKTGKYSNV